MTAHSIGHPVPSPLKGVLERSSFASLIDGDEVRGIGQPVALNSPTTGKPWKELYAADAAIASRAIESAHEAFRHWRLVPACERAEALRRIAKMLKEHRDVLALVMAMEMGKTLREGRSEVDYTAGYFSWFAGEAERVYGMTVPAPSTTKRLMICQEPIGVCALITPWNFPLAMPGRKVAAALAAGCTVVLKPSFLTPVSALLLGYICLHAGVPAGVVNVLYGQDGELGPVLTSSPLVRKLSFTGSVAVGKKLYADCAATLKKVTLELGGHAPLIVCDDAIVEKAVDAALAGKMRNSGQACISPNRFLVQTGIYDEFVPLLIEKTLRLKVGDPLDPGTDVSRILHSVSTQKVERHVADAITKGATLHTHGSEPYYPKVLVDVTPDMLVFQEETFGPVIAVTSFDQVEQAVALANGTDYGLAAYVFTESARIAHGVAEALQAGIVGVNDALLSCPQASFGGVKGSGFGREGGPNGINEYLVEKFISMAF